MEDTKSFCTFVNSSGLSSGIVREHLGGRGVAGGSASAALLIVRVGPTQQLECEQESQLQDH